MFLHKGVKILGALILLNHEGYVFLNPAIDQSTGALKGRSE